MFEGYTSRMTGTRTYGDACGIARALDILGERWALMTVRELLLGPKRFTDLRTGLPHASPNILTQRLRELEQQGIVRKRRLPPPAASQVYELTDRGLEIAPVLDALGTWGSRLPLPGPDATMSFDAHILSFRTLFDPARAEGFDARVELRLGERRFRAVVADGRFEIVEGELADPDAVIASDAGTVLAVAHGRAGLAEAEASGALTITGDRARAERFLGLFPLPEAAVVPEPAAVAA
jgi:DNA-binding HxlR family transcriptional regulator/putative sterol carrier protein